MAEVNWTATPVPNTPDWTENQANETGPCRSCSRRTTLRPDPYIGQLVCQGCWRSFVFGSDEVL